MNFQNIALLNVADASVDQKSAAESLHCMYGFSGITYMTGASTGSLKWQISNLPYNITPGVSDPSWVDLANSTQALSAATNYSQNFDALYYNWCRCVYTKTNGSSGTISVQFNGKG